MHASFPDCTIIPLNRSSTVTFVKGSKNILDPLGANSLPFFLSFFLHAFSLTTNNVSRLILSCFIASNAI